MQKLIKKAYITFIFSYLYFLLRKYLLLIFFVLTFAMLFKGNAEMRAFLFPRGMSD